jgi:hypothetical protein
VPALDPLDIGERHLWLPVVSEVDLDGDLVDLDGGSPTAPGVHDVPDVDVVLAVLDERALLDGGGELLPIVGELVLKLGLTGEKLLPVIRSAGGVPVADPQAPQMAPCAAQYPEADIFR